MLKPLNLDALLTTTRTLEIGGTSYPMKPITARVAMICDAATAATAGVEQVKLLVDAVCVLVPTLPRELAEDLTIEQIGEVIRYASAEVDAVEDAAGNAPGPVAAPGLVSI